MSGLYVPEGAPGWYRQEVACKTKQTFYSRSRAERYRRKIEAKRDEELAVYSCRICGHWHLTSHIEGRRKRRTER